MGTGTHLGIEKFNLEAGIKAVHVPARPGDAIADMIANAVAGRTDLPDGTHSARSRRYPCGQAPCARRDALRSARPCSRRCRRSAEAGVAGFDYPIWYGVWVPAGTPADSGGQTSERHRPAFWQRRMCAIDLQKHGADPMSMTQPEFARFV